MTLEAGRISTCRFPRFSALKMLRRASLSTDMRTIAAKRAEQRVLYLQRTRRAASVSGVKVRHPRPSPPPIRAPDPGVRPQAGVAGCLAQRGACAYPGRRRLK